MVRDPQFLGLLLRDLLELVYGWSKKLETEGLVVQLKKDHRDEHSAPTLVESVVSLLARNSDRC